ncbi:patatin-like phospholipase family protein [Feifania hominis]|uniref:Patatin family protein n=1 Tax=Feifania hominis TaxID=2763660 RepID=A0A926DEJ2_9FIRM|nr:patatin family protein [Feifania hominis]MBC8535575.1 patatin family protein [Feifania hominis]
MTGLVLEGGALRASFTSGVMDAFWDNGILFPYVIGVSAGISNAYSYVNGQRGRNDEILKCYRADPRYLSYGNFLKRKCVMDLQFVFEEIPQKLLPYDYEALANYSGRIIAAITERESARAEYYDQRDCDAGFRLLQATCALPVAFPAIEFQGKFYVDGGVADPIPIRRAIADGCTKNVVVMTKREGYRKHLGKGDKLAARLYQKRYPALAQAVLTRPARYNEEVEFCLAQEREGRAIVLWSDYADTIGRFEKSYENIHKLYENGYEKAIARMADIRAMLGEDNQFIGK